MAQNDFELISDFFTDSGLKYLYRDLESENGNQTIEAMKNALELLINRDQELTENGQVPVLFWYSVMRPKPQEQITGNEFLH